MQLKAKINGSKEIYLPGKKGKVSSTAMLNNLLTNSENAWMTNEKHFTETNSWFLSNNQAE